MLVAMLLHPLYSSPVVIWIGNCFSQCSITLLCLCWASTMRCSRDPSKSASKIFRNADSGISASSRLSSVMSAPFGRDRASAGVLVFPWTWMILKS